MKKFEMEVFETLETPGCGEFWGGVAVGVGVGVGIAVIVT